MFQLKNILYLLVLFPVLSWGSSPSLKGRNLSKSLLLNPIQRPVFSDEGGRLLSFNHKPSFGIGFRNFMVDYSGTLQFKRWFEIGAGVGYHHNSVQFYSASDKHKVSIASIPTYVTATIYPYHNDNRAFYLKGNYGFGNPLNGPRNKRDQTFSSRMIQGGVGYKYLSNKIDRYVYVELSQYYLTAKGSYNDSDTYNAKIDYNLEFYGIVLSVGVNLNRF